MNEIPQELIKSLMDLGLLESEAKIYITLAMMNNSEVKTLIEFLGLSKPNTYESLRLLEEKGLVSLINTRPLTYQALPPEIGLEVLLKTHIDAKDKAKKIFSIMDKEKFVPKTSEALWNVFNGESINYKIKDMIQNAKESIFMISSPKYFKYLENADPTLKLDIILFSETNSFETLKKDFKGKKGNFKVVNEEDMLNIVASSKTKDQKQFEIYKEALLLVEYRNMLMLAIDDEEILYMPPMSTGSLTAINTKNKAMTMLMKIGLNDITNQFE